MEYSSADTNPGMYYRYVGGNEPKFIDNLRGNAKLKI